MLAGIRTFISNYTNGMYFPNIHIKDVIEILIVAVIVYEIMLWIKNTKAWMLLRGIIMLGVFILLAWIFQMHTILYLAAQSINVLAIAAVVVFQPELRRALEQIGRGRLFHKHNELDEKELEDMLNAVTNATEIMSRRKIGALMVFERETGLEERIETGVPIDGLISDSLLLNIFEPDTPLHDGAVVIRGNRIVAASCLLPLTEARNLSQELGTRHRSAIGISEQSDALVLVVSEETGTISLARNGELHRYLTGEDIKSLLRAAVVQPSLNWKQVINDKIKEIRGGK